MHHPIKTMEKTSPMECNSHVNRGKIVLCLFRNFIKNCSALRNIPSSMTTQLLVFESTRQHMFISFAFAVVTVTLIVLVYAHKYTHLAFISKC
uniref:Alternative protein WLS n=1 Tax=Homo sapiens TaxID=9606 RepID=L8E8F2_HUMAN|nr:alternative protein WLS [Homo sapiens]